jgi:HD-GYP domain-containing protein (c-di-GMP phosphodiesterase class II)
MTRCDSCGTPVPARQPVQSDGRRLCEGCFLAAAHPVPAGHGELHAGFAEALADALDLREHETAMHSRRVACHTLVLARRFTDDDETLHQIYWGALLHDLGKIGVPDRILLKEGRLDEAEWTVMRRHAADGHRIVSRLPGMETAAAIVLSHEERFDGSGYPQALRGAAIPFGARLFAVIDTLDAMTSDRPYRRALPFEAARAEIVAMAGRQFDPAAVDAMLAEEAVLRKMVEMKCIQADIRAEQPGPREEHGEPPRRGS